jgi:hypothetical protein
MVTPRTLLQDNDKEMKTVVPNNSVAKICTSPFQTSSQNKTENNSIKKFCNFKIMSLSIGKTIEGSYGTFRHYEK